VPEPAAPRFTVAICTWNRADVLRRALAAHAAAAVPPGLGWELLVVDNGSTDHTRRVAEEFAGRLPLRYLVEPASGLSHARNAAVRAARGAYVAWVDDDVLVDPGWLAAYAAAAERWPGAAVFGGLIAPHFDAPPPAWLLRALPVVGNVFALLDLGPAPRPLLGDVLPFGANYVVRTAEQRRHAYAPHLGRVGANLGAGEETAVVEAILGEGGEGWYVPEARVAHLVPAERLTVPYLRRYYVENAASWAAHEAREPGVPYLLGRPRWAWRQAVHQELLYRVTRRAAAPERWALHLRLASEAWGRLRARARP
jgi:glycosyltransferase involved in cell wall biosynthesis